MDWLDYILIALITIGTIFGIATGPLWQIYRILSVALSVVSAIVFHKISSSALSGVFSTETASILGYSIVFFVLLILTYAIGNMFKSLLTKRKFGISGRLLGGGVALLKTIITCGIIISGVSIMGNSRTEIIVNNSLIASKLNKGSQAVISRIPIDIKEVSFIEEKVDAKIQNNSRRE